MLLLQCRSTLPPECTSSGSFNISEGRAKVERRNNGGTTEEHRRNNGGTLEPLARTFYILYIVRKRVYVLHKLNKKGGFIPVLSRERRKKH